MSSLSRNFSVLQTSSALRILEQRLKAHCNINDIIDDAQEGFLPGRNTSRYLYKMLSSLHEIKRRKKTAFILLI